MSDQLAFSESRIRQIISLIDLTNLDDACDTEAVQRLCAQAVSPYGAVAAICVWPQFLATARACLQAPSVLPLACVVNFPSGREAVRATEAAIDVALSEGASELDYVIDYTAILAGEHHRVAEDLSRIRRRIPSEVLWKVILETGELHGEEAIRLAAELAIDHGADFIKTSTGKVPVNASPVAAKVMLDAIARSGGNTGFKASGGIRTLEDADEYLNLAESCYGAENVDARNLRIGASGLLDNALAALEAR